MEKSETIARIYGSRFASQPPVVGRKERRNSLREAGMDNDACVACWLSAPRELCSPDIFGGFFLCYNRRKEKI